MSLRDLEKCNNSEGSYYADEGSEKYFTCIHFSFIHSFTYVLNYHMARINLNSWLSKGYILIGKVDSQLIITEQCGEW